MTYGMQQPAIRNRVVLGGKAFLAPPSVIQMIPRRFEQLTRVSNLAMRIDRPYIPAGAAMPNVRTRHDFTFQWPTLQKEALLDHLDSLLAKGQPFEFVMWKQAYDIWDGDGATTTFLIQRRLAMPNVTPQTEWADYATVVKYLDKPYGDPTATETLYDPVLYKSTAAMSGTPAAGEAWIEGPGHRVNNLWVSTMKVNPAPPAVADSLVAIYLPLYELMANEQERSYSQGIVEPRTVKAEEFG